MNTLVLYVEDEENDVLFMRWAFREAGLADSLRSVGDGRDAIEYLAGNGAYADRGQHPLAVLILLDLNLPVVVFSSSSREDDRVKALRLGARDFVQKPKSGMGFVNVAQGLKERWLNLVGSWGVRGAVT